MVGFIAHLFVAWLRTGLAADLCWGVPGHDAPGDFRESQPPPQTAKMKFFRHRLWIIAALAFAGWHWLQPRSRAHGYTRPAIDQGQAIEGRCVEVTDGDTIKVLSAGNELIRVRLAFIDTPEKAPAFGQRAKRGIHE